MYCRGKGNGAHTVLLRIRPDIQERLWTENANKADCREFQRVRKVANLMFSNWWSIESRMLKFILAQVKREGIFKITVFPYRCSWVCSCSESEIRRFIPFCTLVAQFCRYAWNTFSITSNRSLNRCLHLLCRSSIAKEWIDQFRDGQLFLLSLLNKAVFVTVSYCSFSIVFLVYQYQVPP